MTSLSDTDSRTKTILIAEDHALFSEGVKLVLESTKKDFQVIQARNGKIALEKVRLLQPEIVLMDIAMPEMNGLEASRAIKQHFPETKIMMLTSFTDEQSLKLALKAGVEAYCSKDIAFKRLLGIINIVLDGGFYLDPTVAHFVLKQQPSILSAVSDVSEKTQAIKQEQSKSGDFQEEREQQIEKAIAPHPVASDRVLAEKRYTVEPDDDREVAKLDVPKPKPVRTDQLTARELELLSLVADYRSNDEIAKIMGISEVWVNGYIKDIIFKLAVDNEVEAVRRAVDDGVITKAKIFEQDEVQ